MGQDNTVPRRINRVEGVAEQVMVSGGPGVVESWGSRATVSTADQTIRVDKEATGAGDGTSWVDAFTTIQAAVDSIEDIILHVYSLIVRHGTKKLGTADANVLNKLHDTGEFPIATTWVGRRVFNIGGTGPADNWGVVSARDSDDQLSIVDITTGAALDLFPNGNEDYVIEPTPYRETIILSGSARAVFNGLQIHAEHYWGADCDAQANVGEIFDADADFSNVEVGDRVFVLDLNGANGRAQNYELGTVDDISQIGANIVRTTLTVTPTANWKYTIVKTEISGSDDGTDTGTTRNYCLSIEFINKIFFYGFYVTLTDAYVARIKHALTIYIQWCICEDCDLGLQIWYESSVRWYYCYGKGVSISEIADASAFYSVMVGDTYGFRLRRTTYMESYYNMFDSVTIAVKVESFSHVYFRYGTILNTCPTGLYARYNGAIETLQSTNNAVAPVDPVGTVEGAYIA